MSIYLIIVIVLFLLAITDLIVGVSNDAVNFLNSAIGARAAKFRVLMILTTIGIMIGATFSSGMMEVARKGIFHPEHFFFDEVMFMFLAVMLTDIILLDTFNSLGMPTSTTVSIVFELLGAAVAMSIIKMTTEPDALGLADYINSSKALAIVLGILLSVFIAFSVGAILQRITRILFSFRYDRRLKFWGAIFGGFAITTITYFMIIKGAKGAAFMTDEVKEFLHNNSLMILGASFIFWTFILEILFLLFRINILRIIVLVGTVALAMAFAGNDLVNFIGVPLAGLSSYLTFMGTEGFDPTTLSMEALAQPVEINTYLLIIAGIIMSGTLWFSRKARSVVKTSVDLSRQNEGEERFDASSLGRIVVRASVNTAHVFNTITPGSIKRFIKKQFEPDERLKNLPVAERPAFDMLRAAVNLVVASILIAIGTSLKLPLSTTYVTFMVAMGTSLADGAWGRESAVYRITGVLSVIGGWFITALAAFSISFVVLLILSWGKLIALIALVLLAAFLIYLSYRRHRAKEAERARETEIYKGVASLSERCRNNVHSNLLQLGLVLEDVIDSLCNNHLNKLKKDVKKIKQLSKESRKYKNNLNQTISNLQGEETGSGLYYVQLLDYLREATHSINYIGKPAFNHVANNHKELSKEQCKELRIVFSEYKKLHDLCLESISQNDFTLIEKATEQRYSLFDVMEIVKKHQLKRIKKKEDSTKASVLFINILQETKILSLSLISLNKSFRDFIENE